MPFLVVLVFAYMVQKAVEEAMGWTKSTSAAAWDKSMEASRSRAQRIREALGRKMDDWSQRPAMAYAAFAARLAAGTARLAGRAGAGAAILGAKATGAVGRALLLGSAGLAGALWRGVKAGAGKGAQAWQDRNRDKQGWAARFAEWLKHWSRTINGKTTGESEDEPLEGEVYDGDEQVDDPYGHGDEQDESAEAEVDEDKDEDEGPEAPPPPPDPEPQAEETADPWTTPPPFEPDPFFYDQPDPPPGGTGPHPNETAYGPDAPPPDPESEEPLPPIYVPSYISNPDSHLHGNTDPVRPELGQAPKEEEGKAIMGELVPSSGGVSPAGGNGIAPISTAADGLQYEAAQSFLMIQAQRAAEMAKLAAEIAALQDRLREGAMLMASDHEQAEAGLARFGVTAPNVAECVGLLFTIANRPSDSVMLNTYDALSHVESGCWRDADDLQGRFGTAWEVTKAEQIDGGFYNG